MGTIKVSDIKSRIDFEYGIDISKQTRVDAYPTARKICVLLCNEFYKDASEIASSLNISRATVSNLITKGNDLRGLDAMIFDRVRVYFRDTKMFTTLNQTQIEGEALNKLMLELSTWEEHRIIELIETKVKPFKRALYL
jgi:peptide subunit release factor RF-3